MKEKFLAFFTGKAGKSAYMIAASAAVCAVAVVSTVVVVHNNNQKLNTALESLSALTSQSESESVTEPSTEAEQTQTVSAQAANGSSGDGDKAIQYLAEYNRLTEEYEKKRAALSEDLVCTVTKQTVQEFTDPFPQKVKPKYPTKYWSETDEAYAARVEQYKKDLASWEEESHAYEVAVSVEESKAAEREKEAQSRVAEEKKRVENAQKRLDELDAQYKKDIEALKQKYGIK
mgnify:FL=1